MKLLDPLAVPFKRGNNSKDIKQFVDYDINFVQKHVNQKRSTVPTLWSMLKILKERRGKVTFLPKGYPVNVCLAFLKQEAFTVAETFVPDKIRGGK